MSVYWELTCHSICDIPWYSIHSHTIFNVLNIDIFNVLNIDIFNIQYWCWIFSTHWILIFYTLNINIQYILFHFIIIPTPGFNVSHFTDEEIEAQSSVLQNTQLVIGQLGFECWSKWCQFLSSLSPILYYFLTKRAHCCCLIESCLLLGQLQPKGNKELFLAVM